MKNIHKHILGVLNYICEVEWENCSCGTKKSVLIDKPSALMAFCYLLDKYSLIHVGRTVTGAQYFNTIGYPNSFEISEVIDGYANLQGSLYPYWISGELSDSDRDCIKKLYKHFYGKNIVKISQSCPEVRIPQNKIDPEYMLNRVGLEKLVSRRKLKTAKEMFKLFIK